MIAKGLLNILYAKEQHSKDNQNFKKELYEERCKEYITKFREKYYKLYPHRKGKI